MTKKLHNPHAFAVMIGKPGTGLVIRNLCDQHLPIPQVGDETRVIDDREVSLNFVLGPHEARQVSREQFDRLDAWARQHGEPGWLVSGLARVEAAIDA